jgi:hypothetical protein
MACLALPEQILHDFRLENLYNVNWVKPEKQNAGLKGYWTSLPTFTLPSEIIFGEEWHIY